MHTTNTNDYLFLINLLNLKHTRDIRSSIHELRGNDRLKEILMKCYHKCLRNNDKLNKHKMRKCISKILRLNYYSYPDIMTSSSCMKL